MFEIRLGMLKETERGYRETDDHKAKCRAYHLKQKLANDLEKYIAKFGFVPNEKNDTLGEIPPGYVNLTELKLKAYDAWKKEKRQEEKGI